jgi:hypothetical protein
VKKTRKNIISGLQIGTISVDEDDIPIETGTTDVEHSKTNVRGKAKPALDVRFEAQNLTSYSGLILFQHFFSVVGIKDRLWVSTKRKRAQV